MAGNPGRSGAVAAITGARRTFGAAVDVFLSVPRPDTTARTYAGTLERLAVRLGRDRPLAGVTDVELADAASELWGHLAPRTWNRHVATVRSFTSWCRDHGWPAGDLRLSADRRAVPSDDSKAIPLPSSSGCGATATSPCGNGRCGGCCTTPPPAPRRPSAWTCPTSTSRTGRRGPASKAATSTSCTSRRLPPGS